MGCYLGNHHQSSGTVRLDDISGIHQAQPDPSANRRSNMAEADLNLVILHRALVILYRALVLQYDLFLIVESLFWYAIPCPRFAVAFQVHFCLLKHIGVALKRSFSLRELRFVRSRIDFDQRLAFADQLAFLIVHLAYQAGDLAGDGVGIAPG